MPLTLSLNTNPLVNRFAEPADLIETVARDLKVRDLQLTHEFINPSWPAPVIRRLTREMGTALNRTGVRVTSIEPGMIETEFTIVRTGGDKAASDALYANMDPMTAQDLAETIWWVANLPPHVNINTLELMPTSQSFAGFAVSRHA